MSAIYIILNFLLKHYCYFIVSLPIKIANSLIYLLIYSFFQLKLIMTHGQVPMGHYNKKLSILDDAAESLWQQYNDRRCLNSFGERCI